MTLRQRARRARARYMKDPSNSRLLAYLKLKARLGQFDERMCDFYRVNPKVNAGCRKAICRAYAAGLVPTSTTGGQHAPGSYHGQKNSLGEGKAVDIGVRNPGSAAEARKLANFHSKEYARALRGKIHPVELIGPHNAKTILRGNRTSLPEGSPLETQHDNHVHEAYS